MIWRIAQEISPPSLETGRSRTEGAWAAEGSTACVLSGMCAVRRASAICLCEDWRVGGWN